MSVMETLRARTTLVECDRSTRFDPKRTPLANLPLFHRRSYDLSEPLSLDYEENGGCLGYDELCLDLVSKSYDFQRSNIQLMTEYEHVVDYTRVELVDPVRAAFSSLGATLIVKENVNYATKFTTAFVFYHAPTNPEMGRTPFMILDVRQPGIIVRDHWLLLQDMTHSEQRILQDMRNQALSLKCPQVCVFDGLNLISIHYKDSGDKIIQARANLELTFDHDYEGYGNARLALRRHPINWITGKPRATIRESCYTMLLEGVRRVACTVLTPPMEIDTTKFPPLQNHVQFWSAVKHLLIFVPTVVKLRQDPGAQELEPIIALHRAPSRELRADGSPKLVVMLMLLFDKKNILRNGDVYQYPISREF